MYILGVHGGNYRTHDASACLLKDGKIIAFAEEDRFIRQKRAFDKYPINAIAYCLDRAKIKISDVECVVSGSSYSDSARIDEKKYLGEFIPKKIFGEYTNLNFKAFDHHLCHAASSFYCSGYDKASVLVVDGEGCGIATSMYRVDAKNGFKLVKSYSANQSLGYIYSSLSKFLGFGSFGAGKLMGLASYGSPKYIKQIESIFEKVSALDYSYNSQDSQDWYMAQVSTILHALGFKEPRLASNFDKVRAKIFLEPIITTKHKDLAASVQRFIEDKMIAYTRECISLTGCDKVCFAGGVALNCVANSIVQKKIGLKDLFIQPACEDSGISIGAALLEYGSQIDYESPCLGIEFTNSQIRELLERLDIECKFLNNPAKVAAKLLRDGNIIGWFQGRMETGPRALGARSILANPSAKSMSIKVNNCKGRETWRPFGPSVLAEKANEIFVDYNPSPFMLKSFTVKEQWQSIIPAVIHVDGTTRPQIVDSLTGGLYHDLINEFYKLTNIPLVLNTSYNYAGEPIVCTPIDAIKTLYSTSIDVLIIGNYLIEKGKNNVKD